MSFKSIPVTAAKVSGSHSSFPALVKPSAITGFGSLTLAEAQSTRFYSDEAKTTELAREVVSADEIYVKIPSLTTTTTIYVEYDGVSSDYAVTDTYGRNAVWADYIAVYHYNDDPSGGSLTDATGNGRTGTSTGSMTSGDLIDGLFGKAWDFDGSDDYAHANSYASAFQIADMSVTCVHKTPTSSVVITPWFVGPAATPYSKWAIIDTIIYRRTSSTTGPHITLTTSNTADTDWHHIAYTGKSGGHYAYLDGADNGNDTDSRDMTGMASADKVGLGGVFWYNGGAHYRVGYQEELRYRSGQLSAAWILTESNNLLDNSAFWGTASDIGGASQNANMLALFK